MLKDFSIFMLYNSNMDLIITKPKRKDYPRIVEVVNSQVEQEKPLYDQREYEENFPLITIDDLLRWENKNGFLIAKDGESIIAFAAFYLKGNNVLWLSEIVVDSNMQKKGVGSTLLSAVENEAIKFGASAIALETQKRFSWAIEFYKKNNYILLTDEDLQKPPFKNLLPGVPVESTYIFGKIL